MHLVAMMRTRVLNDGSDGSLENVSYEDSYSVAYAYNTSIERVG